MQTVSQKLSKIKIPIENFDYDKVTKTLTIQILDFSYVGLYKKSTRLKTILDDIYKSLKESGLKRENISLIAYGNKSLSEKEKIKDLLEFKEEVTEKAPLKPQKNEEDSMKKKAVPARPMDMDLLRDKEVLEEEHEMKRREAAPSAPPGIPEGPMAGGERPSAVRSELSYPEEKLSLKEDDEEEKIVYDVNMGFQYYSVMMEKKSYLFYVFLSHEELKIMDEEGKVIYKTTVHIETTKKEPPVLNILIRGEGFETHPLNGKVVVQKDAVNPPVMIFSVMPLRMDKEKKKKEPHRRFLHVNVEFEEKIISKTILAIIVQPKYFRLDLGPIHFYLSKKSAFLISLFSVLIATGSFIYTIVTYGSGPEFTDILGGFVPGLASAIFFGFYIITLVRGFHPLKQKWNNLLNFGKITPIIK